ncbi:MAG: hypothetical protein JXB48_06295 [Candidatus Latescibacteria bacterium]|nr:hypothetical protein [Candidatus Latescibacterota bacterium]
MITKEKIKSEIDNIKDENLELLYRIIKVFEMPEVQNVADIEQLQWHNFIRETYGSIKDPIKRGKLGEYEVRETIE